MSHASSDQTISPYRCIQELVERDELYPWRVMVVCKLLNQTHGRQVRPMIHDFFLLWPTPRKLLDEVDGSIEAFIRPLGFANRRTTALRRMSREYLDGTPPERCYGVGQYCRDALAIFVHGRTDVEPTDTWLKPYLEWRKHGGPRVKWG